MLTPFLAIKLRVHTVFTAYSRCMTNLLTIYKSKGSNITFYRTQVDDRYHTLEGGPYSYENILQGTEILIDMINGVAQKHRTWTTDMNLKGGICAYNSGVSNVQTYENMDEGTTGNDYSNDVTARSQYYSDNGY